MTHALKEAVGDRSPPCPHSHSIFKDISCTASFFCGKKETVGDLHTRYDTEGAPEPFPLPHECRSRAHEHPGLSDLHVRTERFS